MTVHRRAAALLFFAPGGEQPWLRLINFQRVCMPSYNARPCLGAQFNSFVEISTDFSTEFLVLQGVQHCYEKSVENSVEISTKLLN